jgi:hypothetical protein
MVDGRPKYVTALAETDTAGAWRAHKARGGLLLDIETNEILLRGLSMPHSPRWYQNQLWVLESGEGSLAKVDLQHRTWRTIAQVPGSRGARFLYGLWRLLVFAVARARRSAAFLCPTPRRAHLRVWVVHMRLDRRSASALKPAYKKSSLSWRGQGLDSLEMLEWNDERLAQSYVLPDAALAGQGLRSRAGTLAAFHFSAVWTVIEGPTRRGYYRLLVRSRNLSFLTLVTGLGSPWEMRRHPEALDLQHVAAAEPNAPRQ